MLVLTKID